MRAPTLPLPKPERWHPGIEGAFPGDRCVVELGTGRVPLVCCWCPPTPPGRPFLLGSPPDEPERSDDETQRPVDIPAGFWLAQHPVNQAQWRAVMGTNPGRRPDSSA